MRPSTIVKSDDEIAAAMKAEGKSRPEIEAALEARRAQRAQGQRRYDHAPAARPYVKT